MSLNDVRAELNHSVCKQTVHNAITRSGTIVRQNITRNHMKRRSQLVHHETLAQQQSLSIPLAQFLRLASTDNYHNDPSIAALPSANNQIYEKVYVKPTTEKYDRFIRNGLFDFRPVIRRHPYEYRLQ
uniref:Transposable element Tc3 transposase-like DNA-binding HTH domain-containing protein n=1 Tax=Caenorhabditis japonica TaxID=281687 RepID=A0A8R1ISN9_CAEJA